MLEIRRELPQHLRAEAARLYLVAFERKLNPLLGDQAITLIEAGMNPSNALFAFDGAHLLGMIGFQLHGRKFIDLNVQRIWKHNGLSSLWRLLLLGLLERTPVKHELLLDGICVAEQARGRGVGTTLLEAAVQLALQHGCTQVRLDVVDSNPRARALYERFGFQATRETRTGWLTRPLGFSSSTTMLYRIKAGFAGLVSS